MNLPRDRESEHWDPLDRTRIQLMNSRRLLSRLAPAVVAISLAEVLVLVFIFLAKFGFLRLAPLDLAASLLAIQAGLFTMALISVILFERARKDGDGAFQELSNLFQGEPVSVDEGLAMRVELRRFAAASDLPLVPGKVGPGIYAAANLALLIASIWVLLA